VAPPKRGENPRAGAFCSGMRNKRSPSPDIRLAQLAARQHAVASTAELLATGLSRTGIARRVRSGRLHRKHQGVYAVGHANLSQQGIWLAAVKSCGPRAALSHQSAAQLWKLISLAAFRGWPHVTVPGSGGRRRRPGIIVHRSTTLGRGDWMIRDSIRVTNPRRTLEDLHHTLDHEAWLDAIDRARSLHLPIPDVGPTAPTRSRLERRMLGLFKLHRVPRPEVNVWIGSFLIDFLWRDHRLIVETDSWEHHRDRASFESDRARDTKLTHMGYRVVRITWRQICDDPDEVAASLYALLIASLTAPNGPPAQQPGASPSPPPAGGLALGGARAARERSHR
jgi:very-short-patch-repair endonuclease